MTRRDVLKCIHEPFGDAFYFGPERLSSRYEANETKRIESGFSHSTYQSVLERLDKDADEVRLNPLFARPLACVHLSDTRSYPF